MSVSKVKVQMTVEVEIYDNWGDECTMGQVKKQATEQCASNLKRVITNINGKIIEYGSVSIVSVSEK